MNRNAGPPPLGERGSRALTVDEKQEDTLRKVVAQINRPDRMEQLKSALQGTPGAVERFKTVALHALATNGNVLKDCTPESIVEAVRESAVLGLEPTGLLGEGWILPYGATAKFQPGYRGYLKLLRNSGQVAAVDCQLVYMNDEFDVRFGTDPGITHRPILVGERDTSGALIQQRGDYRGTYAWVRFKSGELVIEWMTTADVEEVKKRSPSVRANRQSPWDSDWGEMARKTVIRRLLKRLPLSTVPSLQRVGEALRTDESLDHVEREVAVRVMSPSQAVIADAAALALNRGADAVVEDAQTPESDGATGQPEATAEPPAAEQSDVCGTAPTDSDYTGGVCSREPHDKGLHRNAAGETWA